MAKWIPICRDDDVYDIKGKHTWAIKCYCSECEYQHKFIEDDIDYIFLPEVWFDNVVKRQSGYEKI